MKSFFIPLTVAIVATALPFAAKPAAAQNSATANARMNEPDKYGNFSPLYFMDYTDNGYESYANQVGVSAFSGLNSLSKSISGDSYAELKNDNSSAIYVTTAATLILEVFGTMNAALESSIASISLENTTVAVHRQAVQYGQIKARIPSIA